MKLRKQEQGLVKTDLPHYYEVKIPNHPNGIPQMHCGMKKDADRLLELYPGSTVEKDLSTTSTTNSGCSLC